MPLDPQHGPNNIAVADSSGYDDWPPEAIYINGVVYELKKDNNGDAVFQYGNDQASDGVTYTDKEVIDVQTYADNGMVAETAQELKDAFYSSSSSQSSSSSSQSSSSSSSQSSSSSSSQSSSSSSSQSSSSSSQTLYYVYTRA